MLNLVSQMSLSNYCCVIEASLTVFSVYFVKCLPQNVLICSEYRLLSLPHLILSLAKLVLPLSFPCGSAVSWKLRLSATSDRNMFWLPIVIYLKGPLLYLQWWHKSEWLESTTFKHRFAFKGWPFPVAPPCSVAQKQNLITAHRLNARSHIN